MAITKDSGRQTPLVAVLDVGYADLTGLDATAVEAIDLPSGAVVTNGWVSVTEVFNSTTSDVLDVGDDADVDRYTTTAPLDLTALGTYHFDNMGDIVTVKTGGGYRYTVSNTIDVIHTGGTADTATTGAFTLYVEYYIEDRANEVQG